MPGGSPAAWPLIKPIFQAIAAKVGPNADIPCCEWVGPRGAGHYVKMVHNGIEYGDMQLIAETYAIMKHALGMSAPEIGKVFERWNSGKLESFLIEIAAEVLAYVDAETGKPLVDQILDEAEQKGTGRWTSQNSFELGTPTPVINAAVIARSLSAMKAQRVTASKVLTGPETGGDLTPVEDRDGLIDALETALYLAKISSYAHGMALLQAASDDYDWDLNLSEIARIWTAGCIIRARLLKPIMDAYSDGKQPGNLMLDPYFTAAMNDGQPDIRKVLHTALDYGIPTPALSWALNYVDTYRKEFLPANLIQGLRDLFGAHTYKRIDKDGTFHTEWVKVTAQPEVTSEPSDRQTWADGDGEGDRSDVPADLPAVTSSRALHPEDHEEVAPDAEEKGARTPASTRKAEY
jgi:6-phosphogluconate dehydrogenase